MSDARQVRIVRNGSVLAIVQPDPSVRRALEDLLTYQRLRFLRGVEARQHGAPVVSLPVRCFSFRQDPDGVLPPALLTSRGYLERVLELLRRRGWEPILRDVSPPERREVFTPCWENLQDVEFRWMQREVIETLVAHDWCRINVPPAFGKSFLIACMARLWPKARIDITTHSVDVTRQIYEELLSYLPDVGMVGGGRKEYDHRVTCYTGKSLHHADGSADVLFVDEVHEFGTDDYLRRVARYKYARRYGMSANCDDRMDGASFELLGAFGEVRMTLSYEECVAHGNIVPIEVRWCDVRALRSPCEGIEDPVARNRRGIWRNDRRNEVIAAAARAFDPEDQVLIVVATVEHAVQLKARLPEFTLVYAENGMTPKERQTYIRQGLLDPAEPAMTAERRLQLKRAFSEGTLKKVIATGVWNRGVDFRRLAVLIRADGQNSAVADTQIPGRVSRLCEEMGKRYGIVVDFKDQFDEGFWRRARWRRKRYEEKGWRQVDWNPASVQAPEVLR